jgi:hypothetical protein
MSLGLVTTVSSSLVVMVTYWLEVGSLSGLNFVGFYAGVVLGSAAATLFGFAVGSRFNTFNEYIGALLGGILPLLIPFLYYLRVIDTPLSYLIPTHAVIILVDSTFQTQAAWDLVYSVVMMLGVCVAGWVLALKSFDKYLVRGTTTDEHGGDAE